MRSVTKDGHRQTYDSFLRAAQVLELFEGSDEGHSCIQEASQWQMPKQLRHLLATLSTWNLIENVSVIFEKFRMFFIEDFLHNFSQSSLHMEAPHRNLHQDWSIGECYATYNALSEINTCLLDMGHSGIKEMLEQYNEYDIILECQNSHKSTDSSNLQTHDLNNEQR